jgi:hypothetical protein
VSWSNNANIDIERSVFRDGCSLNAHMRTCAWSAGQGRAGSRLGLSLLPRCAASHAYGMPDLGVLSLVEFPLYLTYPTAFPISTRLTPPFSLGTPNHFFMFPSLPSYRPGLWALMAPDNCGAGGGSLTPRRPARHTHTHTHTRVGYAPIAAGAFAAFESGWPRSKSDSDMI